jgi:hypothetical protein
MSSIGQAQDSERKADPTTVSQAAFDIWLRHGLHQMFDPVAAEPVPEELLRLIEADRNKAK